MALAELWWSIAQDPMQRTSDRLEASRLLADRGWGKAAAYQPQEGTRSTWRPQSRRQKSSGRRSWRSSRPRRIRTRALGRGVGSNLRRTVTLPRARFAAGIASAWVPSSVHTCPAVFYVLQGSSGPVRPLDG